MERAGRETVGTDVLAITQIDSIVWKKMQRDQIETQCMKTALGPRLESIWSFLVQNFAYELFISGQSRDVGHFRLVQESRGQARIAPSVIAELQ